MAGTEAKKDEENMSNCNTEETVTISDLTVKLSEEVLISTQDDIEKMGNSTTETIDAQHPVDTTVGTAVEDNAEIIANTTMDNAQTCSVCNILAERKQNTIKCNGCGRYIHYHCSRLPSYTLYAYERKPTKKFDCESCVDTPDDFPKFFNSGEPNHPNMSVENVKKDRFADLEQRVNEFSDLLMKFDLAAISNKLLTVGTDLCKTQNSLKEVTTKMQKMQLTPATVDADKSLRQKLEFVTKESISHKNSYDLLVESWEEREAALKKQFTKERNEGTRELEQNLEKLHLSNAELNQKLQIVTEKNQEQAKQLQEKLYEIREINAHNASVVSSLNQKIANQDKEGKY